MRPPVATPPTPGPGPGPGPGRDRGKTVARPLVPQFAVAAALIACGLLPESTRPRLVGSLRDAGRNADDLDRMEAGYYEHLLDSGRRLDLDAAGTEPPPPPPFKATALAREVDDFRECVLEPSFTTVFQRARWTTNALGFRDREYEPTPPDGTYRAVLIGDSIGVGWGVDDGLGFEPILEATLDGKSAAIGGPRVEILNLCVPGYAPGQRREHLRRVGWDLEPDLVIVQATAADFRWDERRLRRLLPNGIGWEIPIYQGAFTSAGLHPGSSEREIREGLKTQRLRILSDVYRALAADAGQRGVPIAWVLLPRVGRPISPAERDALTGLAASAGFDPVIDLSGAFDGLDADALAIGPDDYHPNAEGHAILARRLDEALAGRPGAPWTSPESDAPHRPGSAEGAPRP